MSNTRPPRDNSQKSEIFVRGALAFNERRFWDAHEVWEALWLSSTGDEKLFIQAMIKIAAAYHHVSVRNNMRGARRLFDASLVRLSSFRPDFCGVDLAAFIEDVRQDRATLEESEAAESLRFPRIPLP